MYSVADYLWMLADDTRASAYASAIRKVVRAGDRVLDVGAGFGFFSVIAARAGAAHVDAVDTNPAVHLGARLADANGCAGRITFHHTDVEQLELPHRADVVISDLRGPTPLARRSLATFIDARTRLLRPDGRVIPVADTMFAAPCRVPEAVRRDMHAAFGREGIDTSPVERVVSETPYRCTIRSSDLIAAGRAWARIDYATVATPDLHGSADWTFAGAVAVDGLAVWFETELANGVGFSSGPGASVRVYNQVFLPLRSPIAIAAAERLRVELTLRLVLDEYIWAWTAWLTPADRSAERQVLQQNSIAEAVLDPALLHRRAAGGTGNAV